MPEIAASILPAAPVTPASAPGAVATLGGSSPRETTTSAGSPDQGTPTFLDQLKTALTNLSRGRVGLPGVPTGTPGAAIETSTDAAQGAQPATSGEPADAQDAQAQAATTGEGTDPTAAELPAMLAMLGFVVVPPTLPTTISAAAGSATPATGTGPQSLGGAPGLPLPSALGTPGLSLAGPLGALPGAPQPAATASQATATATSPTGAPASPSQPPADAAAAAALLQLQSPNSQPPLPAPTATAAQAAAQTQPTPTAPPQVQSAAASLSSAAALNANAVASAAAGQATAPAQPAGERTAVGRATLQPSPTLVSPSPAGALTLPTDGAGQPSGGHGGASSNGGDTGTGHDTQTGTAPSADAALAGQAFALGSTASTAMAPAAAGVHPGEVVAQIAHQADLYQLPGNRGLRIQLHPDDLGGVEVTMRYTAAGGLELHMNVEHAATGALVQAGWTELRDALATHGISPERLVMSVTAPSSSGAQDGLGSGSSGSGRQDFGQAAFSFAGSQSGQQRPDQGDARAAFGWSRSSFNDGITSTQPTDSVAPVTADALSRIDYRA